MQQEINLYQHKDPFFIESFDDIIVELTARERRDSAQVLAFCGSDPGVGTTTVAINLAVSLAMAQWNTLLLDGDMRKQREHKHLSSGSVKGLSDYLQGYAQPDEIIYPTNHAGLSYLPCGTLSDHPLRLLGSRYFRPLMEYISQQYHYILIDCASIATANDVSAIATVSDKVIVVAEPNRSTKENLAKIYSAIGDDTEKVGGVIVNKVDERDYRNHRKNYDYFDKEQYMTPKGRQKLREQKLRERRQARTAQMTGETQEIGQQAAPEVPPDAPQNQNGAGV